MLGLSISNFITTPRKTASGNSYENLSTIQRSDQELWTFWPVTLVWSVVWPDETLGALSSDSIATPRKTASRNSSNNLTTIQQSDQVLWTCWARTLVWSMVWPDKTLVPSSSDNFTMPRKTASANSFKNLSTIQRSDQDYGPVDPVLSSGQWSSEPDIVVVESRHLFNTRENNLLKLL